MTLTVTNGPCRDSSSQTVTLQTVSVSLTPDKFCSADKKSYPITVAPAGGQGGGDGVVAVGNGFEFRPGSIPFNTTVASKLAIITYTANGISAQTQVEVFQTPSALFSVTPGTASQLERRFTAQDAFNAEMSWDFGDGSSAAEKAPSHTYKKGGVYTVTLKVSNGSCSAEHSEDITVSQERQKTCSPLNDILKAFADLSKSDPAKYKIFRELYKPFSKVEEYFTKLGDISGKLAADQIRFFFDTEVAGLLASWFESLQPLVVGSDVREMALRLWAILADLAAYIMCIQDSDYDKSQVNLQALYKALTAYYRVWAANMANWSAAEKGIVSQIRNAVNTEITRITTNGEASVKVAYLKDLNAILKMLDPGTK